MKEHLFIASVDHAGRPSKGFEDRGAAFDLDFDGIPDVSEVRVNRYVSTRMDEHFLNHAGEVDFVTMTDGEYSERHKRANRYGADAYLALHVNSHRRTDINQGLFFYDHRTSPGNGDALAKALADEWRKEAAKLGVAGFDVRALPTTLPTWRNPHYTIKGLKRPVGICCEPWFLSNPEHVELFATQAGYEALATALCRGLLSWARGRRQVA